mgnify:CR=1 FL=1
MRTRNTITCLCEYLVPSACVLRAVCCVLCVFRVSYLHYTNLPLAHLYTGSAKLWMTVAPWIVPSPYSAPRMTSKCQMKRYVWQMRRIVCVCACIIHDTVHPCSPVPYSYTAATTSTLAQVQQWELATDWGNKPDQQNHKCVARVRIVCLVCVACPVCPTAHVTCVLQTHMHSPPHTHTLLLKVFLFGWRPHMAKHQTQREYLIALPAASVHGGAAGCHQR